MATSTPPPFSAPHNTVHHHDAMPNDNASEPGGYMNPDYTAAGPASASRANSYAPNLSIVPTEFHVRERNNGTIDGLGPDHGHPSRFHEELSSRRPSSSQLDGHLAGGNDSPQLLVRSESRSSMTSSHAGLPTRSASTLKKKPSLKKKASLKRGGSRKSSRAGSVRSVNLGEKEKYDASEDEMNSAFYVPIPTSGNPTDILMTRFQGWRKVIKDLIGVFRDLQRSCESRAKMLQSASQTMSNISMPATFLVSGGISDATSILRDFHRQALSDANRAKEVQSELVTQLNGLRNDLQQKLKEIKGLAGDFKNSVDKEVDATRKQVRHLHESLGLVDSDAAATSGKGDPFIIKLGVDRQLEKQIEEENYLHRAYLNLESSGRDLESIVVGEIQKAYNAYASILKRDADTAYEVIDRLRDGPISMPKDHEWDAFVSQTEHLIDPNLPVRNVENITYPGKDHPAAAEVRSGMLERKSKYLKSYTPGWFVLSPTHLHEFKSADRITSQSLLMSLYLPEQKIGSHSQPEASSHKFILKGRQTGSMHRGHAWVFRAETHETMMAWYEDIKNLTEKTGEARNAFVRRHAPSLSGSTGYRPSIDSERALAAEDDEADGSAYMADRRAIAPAVRRRSDGDRRGSRDDEPEHWHQRRPWQRDKRSPGEIQSNINTARPLHSPSSPISPQSSDRKSLDHRQSLVSSRTRGSTVGTSLNDGQEQGQTQGPGPNMSANIADELHPQPAAPGHTSPDGGGRHSRTYGEWMTPLTQATTSTSQRKHRHRHRQQREQVNQRDANDYDHIYQPRDEVAYSPTPARERERTHSHPVASSTGAPVVVPDADDQLYLDETDVNHTQPAAGTTTVTTTKEASRGTHASTHGEGEGVDGNAAVPVSRTVSLDPSMSSRRSVGSETMKVPGQFPG